MALDWLCGKVSIAELCAKTRSLIASINLLEEFDVDWQVRAGRSTARSGTTARCRSCVVRSEHREKMRGCPCVRKFPIHKNEEWRMYPRTTESSESE